jgi:hypothetical protein
MFGHISEKQWGTVSDEVSRQLQVLLRSLVESEVVYQQALRLWSYHGLNDTAVAAQLFGVESPSSAQVQMVLDLRDALIAAHNLFDGANLNAIRLMT